MWQKCPVCNGSGMSYNSINGSQTCTVCNGFKIINEINGMPPASNLTSTTTTTDFIDFNRESQQERFGKQKPNGV